MHLDDEADVEKGVWRQSRCSSIDRGRILKHRRILRNQDVKGFNEFASSDCAIFSIGSDGNRDVRFDQHVGRIGLPNINDD